MGVDIFKRFVDEKAIYQIFASEEIENRLSSKISEKWQAVLLPPNRPKLECIVISTTGDNMILFLSILKLFLRRLQRLLVSVNVEQ